MLVLFALDAVVRGALSEALLWLLAALAIKGVDGTMARRLRVAEQATIRRSPRRQRRLRHATLPPWSSSAQLRASASDTILYTTSTWDNGHAGLQHMARDMTGPS